VLIALAQQVGAYLSGVGEALGQVCLKLLGA